MKNLFIVRDSSRDYVLTDSVYLNNYGEADGDAISIMCDAGFEAMMPHLKIPVGHYHRVGLSSRKPKVDDYYELTLVDEYFGDYNIEIPGKGIRVVFLDPTYFELTGRKISDKLYFHVID